MGPVFTVPTSLFFRCITNFTVSKMEKGELTYLANSHVQFTEVPHCCCCAQVMALLLRNMQLGNPWVKVDLCTGKLVEIGGD